MSADNELLSRAVAGDRAALAELLNQSGAALRRKLQGQIARRWQSLLSEDDVLQETYAEAFLDITTFRPESEASFAAWLSSIAQNNLRDAIKGLEAEKRGGQRRRIQVTNADQSLSDLFALLADSGTSPTAHARRLELCQHLQRAIAQLPTAYAHVVQRYDLEGQSADELSTSLGCSTGAVYMRRARAHRTLRAILESFSKFL